MKNNDDHLDKYLSGDAPLDELDGPLRLEEERLREALGTLREDTRAPSTLKEVVMREIVRMPMPLRRQLVEWWFRPRTIRLSPAAGTLALAATIVALVFWPGSGPTEESSPIAGASRVVTRFVLVAPEATSVRLTGDFASWSPEGIELEDLRGTGIWTTDVPLPPGVYQYTFIINGTEWRPDPTALSQVDDGFGQVNSVLIVSSETPA